MDPYQILGVNRNSSPKEIRNAYIKLLQKWHPDLNSNNLEEAEEMTKKINAAYESVSKGKPFKYKKAQDNQKKNEELENYKKQLIYMMQRIIKRYYDNYEIKIQNFERELSAAATKKQADKIFNDFSSYYFENYKNNILSKISDLFLYLGDKNKRHYSKLISYSTTYEEIGHYISLVNRHLKENKKFVQQIRCLYYLSDEQTEKYVYNIINSYYLGEKESILEAAKKENLSNEKIVNNARIQVRKHFEDNFECIPAFNFDRYLNKIENCYSLTELENLLAKLRKIQIETINDLKYLSVSRKKQIIQQINNNNYDYEIIKKAILENESNRQQEVLDKKKNTKITIRKINIFSQEILEKILVGIDNCNSLEQLDLLIKIFNKILDMQINSLNAINPMSVQEIGHKIIEILESDNIFSNLISFINELNRMNQIDKNPRKEPSNVNDNSIIYIYQIENAKPMLEKAINYNTILIPNDELNKLFFDIDKDVKDREIFPKSYH